MAKIPFPDIRHHSASDGNPEALLSSLPFIHAPVCQFYMAGSKYELSLRMQEIDIDGTKCFTTAGLEWVLGIAETAETANAAQIEFSSNGYVDASCNDTFIEKLSTIKDSVSLSRFVTVKVTLRGARHERIWAVHQSMVSCQKTLIMNT